MKDISAITGAEYAERLLAVNSPTRLIDHLIEKLAAKTGTGWESNLLEFKGSYHKRPDSDDPDSQDCFEWNVMHAFVALANAQGGCVVIGIAETDDHRLVPGDWDPDGILGCRDADGDGKPIPGREEKDLVDHVNSIFFKDKFKHNGRTYKFTTQSKRNPSAPPVAHEFALDHESISKLSKLVTFYPCHSERCFCNALAAIVHPVKKDDDLIEVLRKEKNVSEHVIFYRDITAKTCELTKHSDIRHYEENREPASSDYLVELKTPLSRSAETNDIYSTMRSCDPNFVGRQKEIDAIRKICTGGKIVLVHAPGGTGKTELALKFAAEDAAQYPGGSLYVPAETAKTWSDILRNLIDWKTSSTGVTPEEWLGLVSSDDPTQRQSANKQKDSQDKSIVKPIYGDSDVVNALIRKTLDRGPMLLVLDNVEAPGDLLSTRAIKKVFQQGFPQGLHIIATARSRKGVTDRICCETTTLSLDDVSTEDALAIIKGVKEFESADEKEAARKIIDILDHRALYVARIANLKNDFAERSFSRLLKKLQHDKLEVVKPTSDGDDPRTPTVLWQWTKQAIAKSDKSGKCIKLIQTLALFPADGMSADLLEYFWYSDFGKLDPPATLATYKEDPDLFKDDLLRIDAYSLIQKDSTSNTLRMHRLDRAAIRRDLEECESALRTEIGAALHICPIFPANGWVSLAQADSDLMEFCPWEILDSDNITDILIACPTLTNQFQHWSILNLDNWFHLILAHPEFARTPDCKPQYRVPDILCRHPGLSDLFNLEDLNGHVWAAMLSAGSPLEKSCPWERLKKEDWLRLLCIRPELLKYNPHPEIFFAKTKSPDLQSFYYARDSHAIKLREEIDFSEDVGWGDLLYKQPSFSDMCPWNAFNKYDWISIFCKTPQYANRATEKTWNNLTSREWTRILSEQPVHFSHLNQAISRNLNLAGELNWAVILKNQPSLLRKVPFENLTGEQWLYLLLDHPELSNQIPHLQSIADYITKEQTWSYWNKVLLKQKHNVFTNLLALRPPICQLSESEQQNINHPEDENFDIFDLRFKFLHKYDPWGIFADPRELLVRKYTSLKSTSTIRWNNLPVNEMVIAHVLPNLSQFFNAKPTKMPTYGYSNYTPLILQPDQLYYNNSGINEFDDEAEDHLETVEELQFNAIELVGHLLNRASSRCDVLSSRYVKKMNGLSWADLLCIRPDFASACAWEKLDGKAFCLLMINRPSLRKHCDWSKFGGLEWSVLLAENPEFVENCEANNGWSKFSDEDWQYLLDERPWMSKYRPSKARNATSPSRTT